MGIIDIVLEVFEKAIDAEAELQVKYDEDPVKHFKLREKIRKSYFRKLKLLLCDSLEE
ncbi:MAG: hypothetical protein FHOMOCKG_00103 [Methanophagales virus GBV302]|uniref:Uncharacterized protein n=1 Tax=Methanophagales virus GBV302 TaxID=2999281 RepID=A0A9E8VB30_9CAUD|nr:MAG: hypothetical protein QIT37_gp103 [Methanophagales virus GBV302]WAE39631.1 MAG: hypothetical protein FHOMOCKG_00103 [Methanophagales virus GBV302]